MPQTINARPTSILFVCMGNICRSPTAEAVFRQAVRHHRLAAQFLIDSAGTHAYHEGEPPDPRAVRHGAGRGYDLTQLRARPVLAQDFEDFDFILAMDKQNQRHLKSLAPSRCGQKIELLLDYGTTFAGEEVPDPYQGGEKDFARALAMIEDGCAGLLEVLQSRIRA